MPLLSVTTSPSIPLRYVHYSTSEQNGTITQPSKFSSVYLLQTWLLIFHTDCLFQEKYQSEGLQLFLYPSYIFLM